MTDAPNGWDIAAVASPGGHVLQSSAWARIREAQGWRAEFVRIGDPLPVALVLWRSVPVLGELGYVPRGPIVAPGDARSLQEALGALAVLARERGALLLRVDPEISPEAAAEPMRAARFRRAPDVQPILSTLDLDLDTTEDALMAGLEKDTRWSVRQAEKRVRILDGSSDEDLRAFYDLYAETGARARFITRTWDYYRLVWRTLIDAELARLYLAEHEGTIVAGAMTWKCGEREVYQYGATGEAGRRSYAAYGLLWHAILRGRQRGARRFDFGGIPADLTDTSDTMRGPYLFKKGFGGEVRRWAGAHDTVPRELPYRLYGVLEPAYTYARRAASRAVKR
jgi:lipid II:glycine glycyltransferase (peptidoglycan interpeptide bridge formation enzyme)